MSLFLIDGHALAYRSYFAFIKRPLVNSKGEETSAVFGFIKTILGILDRHEPTHVAVAFDSPEKTFRNDIYPEYKAHRPEMPESLVAQFPRIFEVLEVMNIPLIALPGYEADDIIATLSKRNENDLPVRIVSGDKDFLQLVSEQTHLLRPGKGGLLENEVDPAELARTIGLTPRQFVEYQALMGDSSDNVPGVAGVGTKTALKLILDYGSVDGVYANVDKISSDSLRKKLVAGKEKAYLSLELVHLSDTVPIDVPIDDLRRKDFDPARLERLFDDLEFSKLIGAVKRKPDAPEEDRERVEYTMVSTTDELDGLVARLEKVAEFAVDVEASELDPMRAVLAGISVAWEEKRAWYVPVKSVLDEEPTMFSTPAESQGLDLERVRSALGPVFGNPGIRKIGQNIKYDALVLGNAGIELEGIVFDTMLASYSLHSARRSHGLDSLAKELFGHDMIPFKALFDTRAKKKDIRLVPLEKVVPYACEDVDYTLRIKNVFDPLLGSSQVRALFEDVEMPLSLVLTRMERTGVALDTELLGRLSVEFAGNLARIEQSIYDEAGEKFNINSTARLQEILFRKLGLKPSHKTKTGYSTDVEVLKNLASQHPVPALVLEYRTNAKLKSTYIDALPRLVHPKTKRVHTSYNQAVTTTGRLSSSDPNLQNIPIRSPIGKEIRKAFVSRGPDWVLLDADYSQIELRIMAHLSKDAELVKAFVDDDDVHRRTAARIAGVAPAEVSDEMRSRAKTVNFGIMYGMGARGLAQSLGIDVPEARKFIDDYFDMYPGVRRFIDETIAGARQDKAVSTLLGRTRQLPDITGSDRRSQAFSERTAVNTPIQGTAADIIKLAMVEIDGELTARGLRAEMIMQVHDELLFDVPLDELEAVRALVRDGMENAIALDVPLKVDMGVGQNWLEAHS